jgi:hypothetical protein
VDVGATHTGDDPGKSGKETATNHSIFPRSREGMTNFDHESTERRSSLLASGHLHGRRYVGN